MKIQKLMFLFIFLVVPKVSFGQEEVLPKANFFSIGSKKTGICFGNSTRYNGLRLNLFDKGVEKINGINLSFVVKSRIGNGVQICGLGSGSENINGISIATFGHAANKINGLAASFAITSDSLNGVFVGYAVASPKRSVPTKIIKGFVIGAIVGAENVNGLIISILTSYSQKQKGLSIAGLNETQELHGMQIGLLNYAGNNPKLLRWLPILNFHL